MSKILCQTILSVAACAAINWAWFQPLEEYCMKILRCIILVAALFSAVGCLGSVEAASTGKKAFIQKGSVFGTDMYHCDATSGTPVCTKVIEQPAAGGM